MSAAVLFVLLASGSALGASFVRLNPLPGDSYTVADIMSGDGSTVLGRSFSASGASRQFIWDRVNGMRLTPELPGDPWGGARDLSGDGSTLVGRDTNGAYIWDAVDGRRVIDPLPGGSIGGLFVSGDGSTAVGRSGSSAFIWDAENGTRNLGNLPGGYNPAALAVSADGSVVAGRDVTQAGEEAFVWTAESGMQGLGALGDLPSAAFAVSADGSTVVGGSGSLLADEAFIWDETNGMRGLGYLPGGFLPGYTISLAFDVSGDGSVVVGWANSGYTSDVFFWDEANGMRELDVYLAAQGIDLTGWEMWLKHPSHSAFGDVPQISDDGLTIFGDGIYNGERAAWVAVIPEPSTALLTGGGLAALSLCASRRR